MPQKPAEQLIFWLLVALAAFAGEYAPLFFH